MKKQNLVIPVMVILSLLLAAVAFAQPGMGRKGKGWGAGSQYGRLYNPNTAETINGEVVSIDKITPMKGMSYGLHLRLKTEAEEISVHLGPTWYVENQEETIAAKDQIKVTGSRVTFEGKPAIIAAQIQKGDALLVLRDETGFPSWAGWRKGHRDKMMGKGIRGQSPCGGSFGIADWSSVETVEGKILKVEKVDTKMGNWKGIHLMVKAGDEEIPVHLGPEWYIGKENFLFKEGDQIEVSGLRITYEEKPAIVAGEVKKGDKVLTLRDEYGSPAWRGWRRGMYQ